MGSGKTAEAKAESKFEKQKNNEKTITRFASRGTKEEM
jgi:hypothetical protein